MRSFLGHVPVALPSLFCFLFLPIFAKSRWVFLPPERAGETHGRFHTVLLCGSALEAERMVPPRCLALCS